MITWNANSESIDPANDLAGVTLDSPVRSSPEPMQRRHTSMRHRSGRYQNPEDYTGRGEGGLTYAESSVAQPLPGTARSMQQYGVYPNDRSGGYPSGHQQHNPVQDDNLRQMQMQNRGQWQQANHEGGFNVPSLPYAAVSGGGQMSYNNANGNNATHQQYHEGSSGSHHPVGQNQQAYANFNANGNSSGPPMVQQVNNSDSGMTNGELSAASVHELNEQSMGMMHGGIDMDFQMADPSTQSGPSAT